MSILIKGMEMPKCCDICPFGYWSNVWQTGACTLIEKKCFADYSVEYRNKRSDNCPLVEVPTSHGRLIDADLLAKNVKKWLPTDPCGKEEKEFPFETDICVSMMMEIEETSTIIEAEVLKE